MPTFRTILIVALALLAAGCSSMDDRPRFSIEFGADPELFEGAAVTVDGYIVGRLEKTGEATRISFPVDPGMHEICIDLEGFDCQPIRLDLSMKGQKVRLLAEIGETMGGEGTRPMITLRPM